MFTLFVRRQYLLLTHVDGTIFNSLFWRNSSTVNLTPDFLLVFGRHVVDSRKIHTLCRSCHRDPTVYRTEEILIFFRRHWSRNSRFPFPVRYSNLGNRPRPNTSCRALYYSSDLDRVSSYFSVTFIFGDNKLFTRGNSRVLNFTFPKVPPMTS